MFRLKGEIERLEVEYNENISKEQAKYNLDTNKLKDQIFENEVIQKSLEKEVCLFNLFIMHFTLNYNIINIYKYNSYLILFVIIEIIFSWIIYPV